MTAILPTTAGQARTHDQLIFYPRPLFDHSPVFTAWAKLTACDVFALTERPGFEGQNIYFYLNHPIKWVRLAGLIVSFEEYDVPARFSIHLDDGSGRTIELVYFKDPKNRHNNGGVSAINFTGIKLHSIVKAKGAIEEYRGTRQVVLKRLQLLRDTNAEVKAWEGMSVFKRDILSRPWIVDEKLLKKRKAKAKNKMMERTKGNGDTQSKLKEDAGRRPAEDVCVKLRSRNHFQSRKLFESRKRRSENANHGDMSRRKGEIEKSTDELVKTNRCQQRERKPPMELGTIPKREEEEQGKGKPIITERQNNIIPSSGKQKVLQVVDKRRRLGKLGECPEKNAEEISWNDMELQRVIREEAEKTVAGEEDEQRPSFRMSNPCSIDIHKTLKYAGSLEGTSVAYDALQDFENWFANQSLSVLSYELTQGDEAPPLRERTCKSTKGEKSERSIIRDSNIPIMRESSLQEPDSGRTKDPPNRMKRRKLQSSVPSEASQEQLDRAGRNAVKDTRSINDSRPGSFSSKSTTSPSRTIRNPLQASFAFASASNSNFPELQSTEPSPTIRSLKLLILHHIHNIPLTTFTISDLHSISSIKSYATNLAFYTNPSMSSSDTTLLNAGIHKSLSTAIRLLTDDGNIIRTSSPPRTPNSLSPTIYTSIGRWNLSPIIMSAISSARQHAKHGTVQISLKEIWIKARSQGKGWEGVTKGVVGDTIAEILEEIGGWRKEERGIWVLADEGEGM